MWLAVFLQMLLQIYGLFCILELAILPKLTIRSISVDYENTCHLIYNLLAFETNKELNALYSLEVIK